MTSRRALQLFLFYPCSLSSCNAEIAGISNRHIRQTRETVFNAELDMNRGDYIP